MSTTFTGNLKNPKIKRINIELIWSSCQLRVASGVPSYRGRLVSVSDGVLHSGVKVLQRVIVVHLSPFDAVCIATGAGFAEFLKLSRQIAIGIV
ncbi:hypothetical protein C6503_19535 [Candidatus Poribacteria bacterium]|nr:MAG: hypothetical protein C6503_19535 [Candidatus Poribacteria bacterium]